jgi:hypothetical protein
MAEIDSTQVLKPYVAAERGEMLRVLITGLVAGILVPLIGALIASFVIKPAFCGTGQTAGICADGGNITAYHTAAILVGLAITAIFASWAIFRPLPLVVAVTIALWGFRAHFSTLATGSGWEYYVYLALLSALCYGLFYWLMRLRNFPASLILSAIAAGFIYWTLTS